MEVAYVFERYVSAYARPSVCHPATSSLMSECVSNTGCKQASTGAVNTLSRTYSVTRGILAQLGEHLPYKQRVIGSSPIGPIITDRLKCSV